MALMAVLFLMVSSAVGVSLNPGETGKLTDRVTGLQDKSASIPVSVESNSSGVFVSVPGDLPAQSGEVVLDYSNGSESFDVTVNEFSDWGFNGSFRDNVSVGDTGRLGVVNFTQNGNVQSDISVSASGNLTEFISFDDGFTVYPQNTITKTVSYSLPRDTKFGVYNASLNFSEEGSGVSKVLNLTAGFRDDIDPVVSSTSFSDVMSTKSEEFSVVVDENFEVSNVSADIVREVTAERNNETVLVNETVTTLDFEREGQIWKTEFSDTEDIGTYYYKVTATDAAGNTGNKTGMFRVQGLDAVNVLNNNFELKSVKPNTESTGETKALQTFMELDKETEVNISLESLTHSSENSSIKDNIGILKPGDEVAESFDGVDSTITVSSTGVYKLVVESDMVESYSGELGIGTVPQHVEIDENIRFEGNIVDPVYPSPGNFSIGGFDGRIEFVDNRSAVKDSIRFTGELGDAGDCRGVDTWSNCITGFSLGEIPDIKERNEILESANNSLTWQRNISVLVMFGFIGFVFYNRYGVGTIEIQEKIEKEVVGSVWDSVDDVEVEN
jgi:hypothetical protein